MAPKLCYDTLPTNNWPSPPGTITPPLRPPVAIPFQWEEAPGKPKAGPPDPCDVPVDLPAMGVGGPVGTTVFDGPSVLAGPRLSMGEEKERWSWLWRRGGGRRDEEGWGYGSESGGSFRVYVVVDEEAAAVAKVTRWKKRRGGGLNFSTATLHLWDAIYGGLKNAVVASRRSSRRKISTRVDSDSYSSRTTLGTLLTS